MAVGQVVGAHALRGLLRVRPYQPAPPSLAPGRDVVLDVGGVPRAVRLSSVSPHGRGLLLVGVEGVTDRTAAEMLVGARVVVRAGDLPRPGDDEFYYHEVVGYRVETDDGQRLGTITETFDTGTNDVWVVHDDGREHLIPVIADVVRRLDHDARLVVIEPIPGLLDG